MTEHVSKFGYEIRKKKGYNQIIERCSSGLEWQRTKQPWAPLQVGEKIIMPHPVFPSTRSGSHAMGIVLFFAFPL